jgi:predicted exporter
MPTEISVAPTQEKSATSAPAQGSAKETTTASPTTSTTQATPTPTPKGRTQSVVGLVLSLELFQKPGLTQANVFPEVSIVQGIPNDILMHDKNLMSLIGQPDYNQPFEADDLGFEQ